MADDASKKAEQQQERQESLFSKIFWFPFNFLGVMFGSLILAILVDWLCLYFFWPEAGWRHGQKMLISEVGWLSKGLVHSAIVQEPGRTATWLVTETYDWLIVKTGMLSWAQGMESIAHAGPRNELDMRYWAAQSVTTVQNYALAALFTCLVFCVRLVVLLMTIPLFAMAALTGLVDGLVRRDLRKFGAGRESSYLYHKARATIVPLAIFPWTLYLALPISISPMLVLLPCAGLLGLSVSITASSFKKYI
jgi:integrating conjugative element membrane protein (TIGR03747 family)